MKQQETLLLLKALAFAADKHRFQTRKDKEGTPYINHPIKVALTLSEIGKETDIQLLTAAILHDTIEDTETTADELESHFGKDVLNLVLEVTDDKSLSKGERKKLQVLHASKKSSLAKKLKLADKICNVYDVINHPPSWPLERKLQYLQWAEDVLQGLQGANVQLENRLRGLIEGGKLKLREQQVS